MYFSIQIYHLFSFLFIPVSPWPPFPKLIHTSNCCSNDFNTDQPIASNFSILRKHCFQFKLLFPMLLTGAWISLQIYTTNNNLKLYFILPSSSGPTTTHTRWFFFCSCWICNLHTFNKRTTIH